MQLLNRQVESILKWVKSSLSVTYLQVWMKIHCRHIFPPETPAAHPTETFRQQLRRLSPGSVITISE